MLLIAMGLCAVIGLALCVLGIYYLRSADLELSTFAVSLGLIAIFSLVTYFALGPLPVESIPSLSSVPFGFLTRRLLPSVGIPAIIAYFIGFAINFLALVGVARWIQKRREKRNEE